MGVLALLSSSQVDEILPLGGWSIHVCSSSSSHVGEINCYNCALNNCDSGEVEVGSSFMNKWASLVERCLDPKSGFVVRSRRNVVCRLRRHRNVDHRAISSRSAREMLNSCFDSIFIPVLKRRVKNPVTWHVYNLSWKWVRWTKSKLLNQRLRVWF